eukprot:13084231-Alexandrium_andersonii.AAC.1
MAALGERILGARTVSGDSDLISYDVGRVRCWRALLAVRDVMLTVGGRYPFLPCSSAVRTTRTCHLCISAVVNRESVGPSGVLVAGFSGRWLSLIHI